MPGRPPRMYMLATVIALVATACSTASTPATPATTIPPSATTSTTVTQSVTTTSEAVATGPARFAITEIVFGLDGHVRITNIGDAPADLGGHRLCQRPDYFGIRPVTLQPGESVWVTSGDGGDLTPPDGVVVIFAADGALGSFNADDGEMGLYATPAFSDPDAIVDYVEWGSSGHGRSSVAVSAGIWPDGGFVTTGSAPSIASIGDADTPDDWSTG